jgi:hypothetical protein
VAVEAMSMGHTVQLSGAEFAAWSERGRDAARFRVSIRRAARATMQDLGLDVCDVIGPDGGPLDRLYLHRCTGPSCPGLAYSPFDYAHPASCSAPVTP